MTDATPAPNSLMSASTDLSDLGSFALSSTRSYAIQRLDKQVHRTVRSGRAARMAAPAWDLIHPSCWQGEALSDQCLQAASSVRMPNLWMAGLVSFRVGPCCDFCRLIARIHSS